MRKFDIYVTRRIPDAGLNFLREVFGGFEMNPQNRVLTKRELIRKVKGRDGLLCLLTDKIDSDVMDAAGKQLRVFSNCAVGFENIDVAEATERKIIVTNTPGVLTSTTAEMAWALLFSAARRIIDSDRFTRSGKFKCWGPLDFLGQDVSRKTLGVVGAGRIGTAFALMSRGFKMNVLYYSRTHNQTLENELGAKKSDLQTLCRQSDFISLHVNLTRDTYHLIGRNELNLMKPGTIIVNTCRGPVIDEKELVIALREKKIFAAGLDVYEKEPKLAPGLSKLYNTVLAPHLGSATIDTRNQMALLAARNLVAALKGEKPPHCVNPEVLISRND